MNCKKCKKELPATELLDGFCTDCIFKMAEQQRPLTAVTRAELERKREQVEGETAGLFAPGVLDGILEELLDAVERGEDRELAVTKATGDIQAMGGIGACREMLRMAEGLGKLSTEMEEEARRKLGVLMKLRGK